MGFNDLLDNFNTTAIGMLGPVTATVGAADPIPCLFDAPYKGVSLETGEIESSAPALTITSAQVAALSIVHSTSIAISGTPGGYDDDTYSVIEIHPDGAGLTKLILEISE